MRSMGTIEGMGCQRYMRLTVPKEHKQSISTTHLYTGPSLSAGPQGWVGLLPGAGPAPDKQKSFQRRGFFIIREYQIE